MNELDSFTVLFQAEKNTSYVQHIILKAKNREDAIYQFEQVVFGACILFVCNTDCVVAAFDHYHESPEFINADTVKYGCAVCGAEIHHERVEDSQTYNRVVPCGTFINKGVKTNGYDLFYCSKDSSHKIPDELNEALIELSDNQ